MRYITFALAKGRLARKTMELLEKVKTFDLKHFHSISLTGGEPLLHYEFLKEFLPLLKETETKIYLETNGTLPKPLNHIIDYTDIISMDFKLNSSGKIGDMYAKHNEFLEISKNSQKEVFAKLVFDETIQDFEINESVKLAQKYDIELILQPKMNGNTISVSHDKIVEVFNKFTDKYPKTRLIGQVHKFWDVR